VSTIVNSIKHFYAHLILIEKVQDNPALYIKTKGIKRKELYHILSKQELESLYHNFELPENEKSVFKNQNWFKTSELTTKRNKVILGFMIYQGMGTSELSRLTQNDIKLREGKVYITGSRKSNERTLKLEASQIMDIMEYRLQVRNELLALTGKQTERYFVSTGTSEQFSNIMQKFIQKLRKQHPKVNSTQQIRTSVITHWLKYYNLRQVQYMAGHRYVSTTEGYLVNDLDDLSEEIGKFHPMG
jgi:integrase/recombinase XerD